MRTSPWAVGLGALLATGRSAELNDKSFDRIVPIPQHWRQRLVRRLIRAPLVDVVMALNLTVSGIVAHQSALKGGESLKIPQYKP